MSSPRGASLRSGLLSGLWIQCAPRSNGTPKILLSVTQRPPTRPPASINAKLLLGGGDAARGRDAGGAGADDGHIHVAGVRRERASAGAASSAAEAARNERRLSLDMVSEFFPGRPSHLPEPAWRSKFHG